MVNRDALALVLAMAGHVLGDAVAFLGIAQLVTQVELYADHTWLRWLAVAAGLAASLYCWIIATEQVAALTANRR
jgi:hypothetical protein